VQVDERCLLDDGRRLHLLRCVRQLPGKREVWQGELDGQQVFAKFYLDLKRGKVHWQRELDGIKAFQSRGIPSAELCHAGSLRENGLPVIVLKALPEAESLKEAWESGNAPRRERLLREMMVLLARHHRAGLCQTDLHFGNFVIAQGVIHSLDGDGVKTVVGELNRECSLENLGLFFAQLFPEWESKIPELYSCYLEERGWNRESDCEPLLQQLAQARSRRWAERQGKLFRECTAFICRKREGGIEVLVRTDASPELEALLSNPDASFPGKALALKNGNTCTVWAAQVNDLRLVIKRYNIKSLWHGIKLSTREGRAFLSWVNAHRLLFYGIPTPRPVALVKIKRGAVKPVAYFITEQVDGVGSHQWFRDGNIPQASKAAMVEKIGHLFRQLGAQLISHGDLKASNILIVDQQPVLIDLDAMQQHANKRSFRKAWEGDLQRFMQNWDDAPELKELFNGLNLS